VNLKDAFCRVLDSLSATNCMPAKQSQKTTLKKRFRSSDGRQEGELTPPFRGIVLLSELYRGECCLLSSFYLRLRYIATDPMTNDIYI